MLSAASAAAPLCSEGVVRPAEIQRLNSTWMVLFFRLVLAACSRFIDLDSSGIDDQLQRTFCILQSGFRSL
jgi:hypothetical protein